MHWALGISNQINGEQAIFNSLKPFFSVVRAYRESNRIPDSAFRSSVNKPKPKLIHRPIRVEEIVSKNLYEFK